MCMTISELYLIRSLVIATQHSRPTGIERCFQAHQVLQCLDTSGPARYCASGLQAAGTPVHRIYGPEVLVWRLAAQ